MEFGFHVSTVDFRSHLSFAKAHVLGPVKPKQVAKPALTIQEVFYRFFASGNLGTVSYIVF